jgi:hypothetical protein
MTSPDGSSGSISSVLLTWHFALNALFTVVSTCGINYYIDRDKMSKSGSREFTIVGTNTFPDTLVFTAIVALVVYAGSGGIRKRIAVTGDGPRPLRAEVLESSMFARVFMGGHRTVWSFVGYSLVVPGIVVSGLQTFACWYAVGFDKEPTCRTESLDNWLLCTEATKGLIAVFLYTLNYISAHDERQTDVQALFINKNAKKKD